VERKLAVCKQVSKKTFVLPIPLTAPGGGFCFGVVQPHSITWKLVFFPLFHLLHASLSLLSSFTFLRADSRPYLSLYKCVRQCSRNSPCIAWPLRMGPIRCP